MMPLNMWTVGKALGEIMPVIDLLVLITGNVEITGQIAMIRTVTDHTVVTEVIPVIREVMAITGDLITAVVFHQEGGVEMAIIMVIRIVRVLIGVQIETSEVEAIAIIGLEDSILVIEGLTKIIVNKGQIARIGHTIAKMVIHQMAIVQTGTITIIIRQMMQTVLM